MHTTTTYWTKCVSLVRCRYMCNIMLKLSFILVSWRPVNCGVPIRSRVHIPGKQTVEYRCVEMPLICIKNNGNELDAFSLNYLTDLNVLWYYRNVRHSVVALRYHMSVLL